MSLARIVSFLVNGRVYPRHLRDPEVRELHRFTGPGNRFKKAQEVLTRARSAEDRSWLIDEFARDYFLAPHELRWAEAEPANPLGHTLAGVVAVHWAWRARTGARAKDVSAKGWQGFFERLDIAERYLRSAIRLDKHDPVPLAAMMAVHMGRGDALEEAEELFHRAIELSPMDWMAHQTMLSCACAKWGGSDQKMRAVVGKAIAKAPRGSSLHALVPILLLEEYIAITINSDPRARVDILDQPHFRSAVTRAHDAYLRQPQREIIKRELAHRNAFAATLAWTGAIDRAHEELDHIGGRIMEMPWILSGWHPKVAARAARSGKVPPNS